MRGVSIGEELVDAHLAKVEEPHRTTLRAVRAALRKVLPEAQEGIKYNMPSFIVDGKGVAAYEAFRHHCSYFPFSGNVIAKVGQIPGTTMATTGTLQFPIDRPLAIGAIRTLVRVRLDEISDVAKGRKRDYYDDGRVKAAGSMKDGLPNGAWTWYRKDGTVERTGKYRLGEPVGTWETWDRDGRLLKAVTH